MSTTYCPLPWIFQAIRNNGQLRICCQANVSEDRGLLKKADGTIYNVASDNIDDSRNSELMKTARLKMLNGQWPSSCSRCQSEEAAGLRSRRTYENESWGQRFSAEWAAGNTAGDGSIDVNSVRPIYFDIRPGNKCNLKCRMCGPTDSNLWYEDYFKTVSDHFADTQGDVRIEQQGNRWTVSDTSYDWHESDVYWDYLKKNAQWIEHLHIVGGEPLLIENHYKALEYLRDNGYAGKITLEYNTNLMLLPQKALDLWKSFRKVRIGVSLDGFGAVNDYIRAPSKWDVIVRNLQRLNAAPGQFDLWLSATIQIYNIYTITDMIRWKLESGLTRFNSTNKLPFITSHVLHQPRYYNIRALPPASKAKVRKKFADFEKWFEEWSAANVPDEKTRQHQRGKLHALLNSYAVYMDKEDLSRELKNFWSNTQKLDEVRKQSFAAVMPELAADIETFLFPLRHETPIPN